MPIVGETNTGFSREKVSRWLGDQIQPMTVAVKDRCDGLMKEGLLAESR
jgi:hypothetical protein